jgi:hypothetical protein
LVIDGGQKEHVPAFDEGLMFWRNFGEHYARFNIVSQPSCVEAVLQ